MSSFQRACIYIVRKKVRTFLLFLILLVTTLFLLVGISIRSSAKKAAYDVRKTMPTGLEIQLQPCNDKLESVKDENGHTVVKAGFKNITESKLDEILAVDGVSGYFEGGGGTGLYTGLEVTPGYYARVIDEYNAGSTDFSEEDIAFIEKVDMHKNGFYSLIDSRWYQGFLNGALELVSGRHIQKEDRGKAIISEELAKRNNLKIGDKIEAQQFDGLTEELYGDVYEIEIVGIFRIHFKQKISEFTCEDYILENMIFTDMEMNHWWQVVYSTHYGNDVRAREKDRNYGHLMLYVEDPEMQDSVREELLKIDSVDWEYYKITVYDHDYKVAAKPLRMILSFTNTMIIVMAVGSLVILSLILTMWVKSRKREIGILSSIGVNKRTILKQLLLESCLVAIVAFLLAGVFAKTVTDGIGTGIVNIINITSNSGAYEVISSPGSSEYAINKLPGKQEVLDYAVTPEILVVVFGVMLLVVVSSVLFSSLRIIRQKPREMLGR